MAAKEKQGEVLIVNRRTGKVLQCTGLENGQVVVQAAPTGESAQLWSVVKVNGGVKLLNKACGKVLDVMHGGVEAGTWAQTWEDVSGDSQLWQLVKVTATYKKLMNVQAGKALDIVDMREDDGAPAQIWDDVDGIGQQWKLADASEAKSIKTRPHKAAEAPAGASVEEAPAQEEPARKGRGRKPTAAPAPAVVDAPKEEAVAEAPAPVPVETVEKAAPAQAPAEEKPAPKRRGRKPKAEPAPKRPGRKAGTGKQV